MVCYNPWVPNSGMYGLDISQIRTDEQREWLHSYFEWSKLAHSTVIGDGLIYMFPEMIVQPWDFEETHPMKGILFRIGTPSHVFPSINDKWEPFFGSVSKEYGWDHVEVFLEGDKDVHFFYKKRRLPIEPTPFDIPAGIYSGWEQSESVEQGGIVFKNRMIWDDLNVRLAFCGRKKELINAVRDHDIIVL